MSTKLYHGAPFGVQSARFDVAGVHPQNKPVGSFTQMPYCKKSTHELTRKRAPGTYEIAVGGFSENSLKQKASGPDWKRSYETKKMSQIPHLLYREEWLKKKELKRNLGPGKYDIDKLDFLDALEKKPRSTRGICSTREERFRNYRPDDTPAPGTYGKGGVPAAYKEEKETISASTVGMLDSASAANRSLPTIGCDLAPGRYEAQNFTDEVLAKVVSKRGPYDVFTGERGKRDVAGHYAVVPYGNLGPGQYNNDVSFLEKWTNEHLRKHGEFAKIKKQPEQQTDRIFCSTLAQWPRSSDSPAPNSYQHEVEVTHRKLPAFLSTAARNDRRANRFFTGNFNPVGPGRYEVLRWKKAQHVYASAHVFNSTNPRFDSKERDFFMKERVRQKDVSVSSRSFLLLPDRKRKLLASA